MFRSADACCAAQLACRCSITGEKEGMQHSYGNFSEDTPVNGSGSAMQPDGVAPLSRAARTHRSRRLRHAFAGVLALALVIGACEGDNLFSGDSEEARPRIVSVSLPQVARAGDTLAL